MGLGGDDGYIQGEGPGRGIVYARVAIGEFDKGDTLGLSFDLPDLRAGSARHLSLRLSVFAGADGDYLLLCGDGLVPQVAGRRIGAELHHDCAAGGERDLAGLVGTFAECLTGESDFLSAGQAGGRAQP